MYEFGRIDCSVPVVRWHISLRDAETLPGLGVIAIARLDVSQGREPNPYRCAYIPISARKNQKV